MTSATPIVDQAAEWIGVLDSDTATDIDRAACEAWCALDARHRATFDAMLAMHRRLDEVDDHERDALRRLTGKQSRANRMSAKVAVGLVAFVVAGGIAATSDVVRDRFPDYATARGEQRSVALADGSQVLLDTKTQIRVDGADHGDIVRLVEGRLFAKVHKDSSRRFVVETTFGSAMAKGTAFSTELAPDMMIVTVTESIVQVCPRTTARRPQCRDAGPGERVMVTQGGVQPVERVDVGLTTRWTSGSLAVVDEELATVVEDLNRYLDKPVRLATNDLGAVRISGNFPLHDPQRALRGIADAANLELRTGEGGRTILAR